MGRGTPSRTGADVSSQVGVRWRWRCSWVGTFFVQLSQKHQAITVRLLPATDPEEKTPAVKRLMALVARRIRQIVPRSYYGKTNLQDFLTEPDS